MDEKKVQELLKKLEDPNVSPIVKKTVQQAIEKAMTGGYSAAYEEMLKIRARTDLDAFAEYVFGLPPKPHHKEITKILQDDKISNIAMILPPGAGKCVAEDTLVSMSDGTRKEIKDVEVGDSLVSLSEDTLKLENDVVVWKEYTGEKACLLITTKSGNRVKVTPDHRMYTFDGWVKGKDLRVGSFMAQLDSNPIFTVLGESEVYWDEVVSIQKIGAVPTYDIQVAKNNNFFAEGLLSHNSTYVGQIYLPWYLGRHPEHSSILVSSSADQSKKFTSDVRSTIVSSVRYKEVFPEVKVDELKGESREQIYLQRERPNPHPNLFAAGSESTKVLGSRANVIICDDIQTQKRARSVAESRNQREWFEGTLMTRPIPDTGRVISIMTRWAGNDMAAFLMNNLNFHVMLMPALGDAEGAYLDFGVPLFSDRVLKELSSAGESISIDYNDPLKSMPKFAKADYLNRLEEELDKVREEESPRKLDLVYSEALKRPVIRKHYREDINPSVWPDYFKHEMLEGIKAQRGTVAFNLIYQGNPVASEGDIFRREWFQYYGTQTTEDGEQTFKKKVPDDAVYFMSVDPAISQKESADYFVVAVMARDKQGNVYVVHVLRTRLEAPDQKKAIKRLYSKYPQTVWVLVESVAYQQSLFQELIKDGIPCRKYIPKAGKDKEMRARSASVYYEAEKIYHPASATWLKDFEDELTAFPRADKDDQVDAISSLLEELSFFDNLPQVTYQVGFG